MYELKKNGKVLTSKSVGTGPSCYEKGTYWAAVSQRLRNTDIEQEWSKDLGAWYIYCKWHVTLKGIPEFAYVITIEKLGSYIYRDPYIQYVHKFSCSFVKMLYSIL